jgi:hypothetical protein
LAAGAAAGPLAAALLGCCPLLLPVLLLLPLPLPLLLTRRPLPWKLLALHLVLRNARGSAAAASPAASEEEEEEEGLDGQPACWGCSCSCCCTLGAMGSSSTATNCARPSGRWHRGPRAMHSAATCKRNAAAERACSLACGMQR